MCACRRLVAASACLVAAGPMRCSACCNCFVSGTSTACRELEIILSPLVALEVRGLPALQYFGQQVWQQSAAGQEAPQ